jgi:hypothetical protein
MAEESQDAELPEGNGVIPETGLNCMVNHTILA